MLPRLVARVPCTPSPPGNPRPLSRAQVLLVFSVTSSRGVQRFQGWGFVRRFRGSEAVRFVCAARFQGRVLFAGLGALRQRGLVRVRAGVLACCLPPPSRPRCNARVPCTPTLPREPRAPSCDQVLLVSIAGSRRQRGLVSSPPPVVLQCPAAPFPSRNFSGGSGSSSTSSLRAGHRKASRLKVGRQRGSEAARFGLCAGRSQECPASPPFPGTLGPLPCGQALVVTFLDIFDHPRQAL